MAKVTKKVGPIRSLISKIPTPAKVLIVLVAIFSIVWFWPASPVENPTYGATFSAKYARELGLDAKEVYESMLRDLGIKKVRLIAYWDEIESTQGQLDFSDLDWQIKMSERYGAEVVLVVGRRVPRWPECHVPDWAYELMTSKNDVRAKADPLKNYITATINRYKDVEAITHWQVENESFFTLYAPHICGDTADAELIDEEIELVREIDSTRPIIMTDSGNLGTWKDAFPRGDVFGSTFYVYLMFDGKLRTPLTHNFYKMKKAFWSEVYGERDVWLIEISVEPYLQQAVTDTPVEELADRLSINRVKKIIDFAQDTGFQTQYLWGIEWHYYMMENGYSEYWDYSRDLFSGTD